MSHYYESLSELLSRGNAGKGGKGGGALKGSLADGLSVVTTMAFFHCMPFCLGTKKPRFDCWVGVKVFHFTVHSFDPQQM